MARNAIVGPNPIGTARLTSDERLKELSSILALGAIRLRLRREARHDGRADGQLASSDGALLGLRAWPADRPASAPSEPGSID